MVGAVEPIAEGHSGFTYWVDVDGKQYVLRLSPPGARPLGPADVARQGRIMTSLAAARLPVPTVAAMSSDAVVDGRPFVLMQRERGQRIEVVGHREPARALAESVVAVLKQLHALPLERSGIANEPPTSLPDELRRWAAVMARAAPDLTKLGPGLCRLLNDELPQERAPCLVHGDFHMGNMLFRGAKVVAVLDWEIAEIGQPLIDLGCLCVMVARRRFNGSSAPGGFLELEIRDFIDLYGVHEGEMRWYLAMSLYKYAAILGYNTMLHRKGRRVDARYETDMMAATVAGMIQDGVQLMTMGSLHMPLRQ